jgi:phosphate transport system substrate-binding protein
MNDDFLRNLRRPPSADFARQLRARLREQELPETSRRRPNWKLLIIAMLAGGTALATATYLTMDRAPWQSAPATGVAAEEQATTASQTPLTSRQAPSQWWGSGDDTTDPDVAVSSPSVPTAEQTNVTSGARAGDSPSADASSGGGTRAGGAISVPGSETSTPAVQIATTPDIAAIVVKTLPLTSYLKSRLSEVSDVNAALRSLCIGASEHPEIVITSRRITKDELSVCNEPWVGGLLEATLGHAAVVITGAQTGSPMQLSRDAVLRAVLKRVPSPEDPTRLIDNPYTRWNQINGSLEDRLIEIVGPARDTPEFLVFAAALLEPACDKYPSIQALRHTDRPAYEEICFSLREDGVYGEMRLDNTFVRQRLWSDPKVIAVVDYPFYSANSADFLGSLLTGEPATRESILNGKYSAARTLYLYVPRWRYERHTRVRSFLNYYLRIVFTNQRGLMAPDGNTEGRRFTQPVPLTEVKLN